MTTVYLDSCIVIYLVQGSDSVRTVVEEALRPVNSPEPSVSISPLTRLECRIWPMREEDDELLARFDRFFASQDVRRIACTAEVFDAATALRARFNVKTPDALHLGAAIVGGCDEFWTNDRRLPRALEKRIKVRVLS